MKSGRDSAAAIVYNNSIYIFGGYDYNTRKELKTSGIIHKDGMSTSSTDLPMTLLSFAITLVNDTVSIITGGGNNAIRATKLSWYFNHLTQEFSKGPDLLIPRRSHASGTLIDGGTNEKIPVVAGGMDYGITVNSTEFLLNEKWNKGEYKI